MQPHSPDNRALARECKYVKIDRVYIGSCTGGKIEDFMAVAKVFLAAVRLHFFIAYTIFGKEFRKGKKGKGKGGKEKESQGMIKKLPLFV